ncbi:AMP-binding protein [Amycolatopsis taiwanensis]|uniref:O-succinylbenzoic acid--CoA ligase MenE n=1 Tax=Amycolatopsis taiwanensis TaxID=342230 RepID=A0A9W6R9Q0_9PSEU|nr:AMP-binding protein [Amycolatopsis taiwanensis]GLY71518.1 putative O-succinylbenzoic acid--CoA ligase MenE [Amycolatopsis taiwanensis]
MHIPLKKIVLSDDRGTALEELRYGIDAALSGGVAIAPVSGTNADVSLPDSVSDDIAVVITTSGSTGRPKKTMLSRNSLRASAAGVRRALGGPGGWLLTLPPSYVAGFQVVARSVLFDSPVVCLDGSAGFTTGEFVDASRKLHASRRYVSVVPTQLRRMVADPAARDELSRFDAVLVGGARLDPATADQARPVATIRTTYGMTETCGGCVYDGIALDGVRMRIVGGEVHLGGPVLADGYLDDDRLTAAAFYEDSSGRWYRTADRGRFENGRLEIEGRLDDVINTGGVKVPPRAVDECIESCSGVEESLTFGIPDDEWGEAVVSYVCARPGSALDAERLRGVVRERLDRYSAPRSVLVSDDPPRLPNGKLDRMRIHEFFVRRKERC